MTSIATITTSTSIKTTTQASPSSMPDIASMQHIMEDLRAAEGEKVAMLPSPSDNKEVLLIPKNAATFSNSAANNLMKFSNNNSNSNATQNKALEVTIIDNSTNQSSNPLVSSCPATITSTTTSYSPSLSNTTGTTTLASTNMNNKTSSAAASSAFLAMPTSRMSSNDNIIIRNQSNENKKSDAARSHSSSMTPNTSCNTDPNTNSDDENENLLLHRRSQSNELHYNLLDELRKEAEEDLQNEKLRRLARQHVDRQTTATTAATSSSSQASQVKQNNRELEEVNIGMGYRSSCDPEKEEQLLFEQRLCENSLGVALRKINSNGKSQLRYVRCIACDEVTTVCTKNRFPFQDLKATILVSIARMVNMINIKII